MYDIRLTEAGDLDLDFEKPVSSFKVKFSYVDYGRQRVSFIIAPPSMAQKKNAAQRVSFKFSNGIGDYKLQDKSMDTLEEAVQAIRVALRTENKDVHDLNIGSYAYQLHHQLYRKKADLEDTKLYIQKVVDTILPDTEVSVEYAADERAGYFKYQAVKVHIDYNGKKLDEFIW